MKVLCITAEGRSLFSFEPSFEPFDRFLSELKYGDTYYMITEHEGVLYSSHLNQILNTIPPTCNTWAELEAFLTVGLLVGTEKLSPRNKYMWSMNTTESHAEVVDDIGAFVSKPLPIESITKKIYRTVKSVTVYPFDVLSDIGVDFGTKDNPSIRNLSNYKSKLPDLIFRKDVVDCDINFNNTIPIINGVCHRPMVHNNELYAPDGVEVLPAGNNKNIILLDFSPVGNIDIVPLKDCTRKSPVKQEPLEIVLPTNKTTHGKTVILVLGGRMFFPKDIYIPTDRMVTCYLNRFCFNNILISNKLYRKEYDTNFGMSFVNINNYVNTRIWEDTSYRNFIILIDNPDVKFLDFSLDSSTYSISTKHVNMLDDDNRHSYRSSFLVDDVEPTNGFLMRNINRDIVDFTVAIKNSRNLVMIAPPSNIVTPDLDVGYIENSAIRTYGDKISSSSYVLKDIFIEVDQV